MGGELFIRHHAVELSFALILIVISTLENVTFKVEQHRLSDRIFFLQHHILNF